LFHTSYSRCCCYWPSGHLPLVPRPLHAQSVGSAEVCTCTYQKVCSGCCPHQDPSRPGSGHRQIQVPTDRHPWNIIERRMAGLARQSSQSGKRSWMACSTFRHRDVGEEWWRDVTAIDCDTVRTKSADNCNPFPTLRPRPNRIIKRQLTSDAALQRTAHHLQAAIGAQTAVTPNPTSLLSEHEKL
jgi:hypothetical protein